jgi:exosortase K
MLFQQTQTRYSLGLVEKSAIGNRQSAMTRLLAQLVVVLLTGLALKYFYSTANPNQLRWILAPTAFLVELFSERTFEFESHMGYLSNDQTFLIAGSCAGVNFLITAFLMLTLRKLWVDRNRNTSWLFILSAAVIAYAATLVANTVRIATALRMQQMSLENSWLSGNQLHRLEGIFVYFGFLLLLYLLTERLINQPATVENGPNVLRQAFFPLLIYYATMLGIPLANGAYHQGSDFWQHALFVLLTPLLLVLPLVTFRFRKCRMRQVSG